MPMTAHITTIHDQVWLCPITLQVIDDWERWSKKTIFDIENPTARDFGFICWRAAFYAGKITKRLSLSDFMRLVCGWDIINTDLPVSVQVEEWLKEQDNGNEQ